jgi:DNA mismatch repair protein MutS2
VEAALQDDIITTRGDRFVIPVKANLRRDVPGLVHDYSSTGATVFVEPMEMVEDNNRLNFLRRSEQEEAFKVLAALSRRAAEAAEEIQRAARILGSVDALFAAARFSLSHKCVAPELSEAGDVDLPEARHPLLMARFEPASVVPVDLKQPADKRALVVSGVNAGGKTVALKTLGLLVLMAKTGLHLPVREDARLPLFENVMAVIGDDQDLNSDLSTFSGHVRRLTQVLDRADDGALVLLDELGTGTDPAEGAALALAVLESLHQRGAYLVTATHYHLLKTWAYLTDGVENAAVRTGPDQRPIFGLEYGAPGLSGGLSMARELGLDPELVRRAESYLDEGQKKTLELMEGLERERAALAQARQEHEHQIDELSQAASWIKQREKKRQEAYDSEIRTLRTKIGQTIRRVDDELAEAKRQMKTQKPEKPIPDRLQRIKRDLKNALPKGRSQAPGLAEVRPGERVRVSNLGREGRVVSVNEAKKQAKIDLGGLTADVPWKDLEPAQAQRSEAERESRRVQIKGTASPPREINLLGLTVDEALPEVDKSLDQALMGGIRRLAIIHGVGTGRLRQAVRGLLQEDRRVKSFGPGERRAGGAGVTMVDMNV